MAMNLRNRPGKAFPAARERYAALGVNVDHALQTLARIPISLHCWQGDDVGGFENFGTALGGGLVATGHYPGKARTPDELRADLEKALSLIPGKHRLNLHACYGEFGGKKVDRDEITPAHFQNWIAWAKQNGIGLDFNPTCFSHPKAADGFTLSHPDKAIRQFWIEHCLRCREIGAAIGKALGQPCVTNVWIPDGMKDTPADRHAPRARLAESLDAIFKKPISPKLNLDAVEPKLFGIGSRKLRRRFARILSRLRRQPEETADAGRRPLSSDRRHRRQDFVRAAVPAGNSAARQPRRPLGQRPRRDSERRFAGHRPRNCGERFRRAACTSGWIISTPASTGWPRGPSARATCSARCSVALLEPTDRLRAAENAGDYTTRLALQEEIKSLPFGAVWDFYCESKGVPVGEAWLAEVKRYEKKVLSKRP